MTHAGAKAPAGSTVVLDEFYSPYPIVIEYEEDGPREPGPWARV